MSLAQLAERIDATVSGDQAVQVTGCAPIDQAGPHDVTFLVNAKYQKFLDTTQAAAVIVDAEVSRLLREAEERAITLLTEGRTDLDQLTKLLLDNETIDGKQVYDLVGRPFPRRLDDEVSPGLWEEAVSSPTTEHT